MDFCIRKGKRVVICCRNMEQEAVKIAIHNLG